jgi:hypothetical protein
MMFGSLCSDKQKEKVMSVLNVASKVVEEKNLGLPAQEGHIGKGKFKSTKEKLVKRFSNWDEKHMSIGAKEVLIKSITQAILTYVMGIFKLPVGMCEEMAQLIRKF